MYYLYKCMVLEQSTNIILLSSEKKVWAQLLVWTLQKEKETFAMPDLRKEQNLRY